MALAPETREPWYPDDPPRTAAGLSAFARPPRSTSGVSRTDAPLGGSRAALIGFLSTLLKVIVSVVSIAGFCLIIIFVVAIGLSTFRNQIIVTPISVPADPWQRGFTPNEVVPVGWTAWRLG